MRAHGNDRDSVLTIRTKKITVNSAGFCGIMDITAKVSQPIEGEDLRCGPASLFVSGSTAALTAIEYKPGLFRT